MKRLLLLAALLTTIPVPKASALDGVRFVANARIHRPSTGCRGTNDGVRARDIPEPEYPLQFAAAALAFLALRTTAFPNRRARPKIPRTILHHAQPGALSHAPTQGELSLEKSGNISLEEP